jgi:pentatricopeptide repeat protein
VNPTRASRRIRSLCRAGRWEILPHAVERMIERGVTVEDVRTVLTGAKSCRAAGKRWRLSGPDVFGEPLDLIVELLADVLVVTLFRGDE